MSAEIPLQDAMAAYLALQQQVDHAGRQLAARHWGRLVCGPGCDQCCTLQSVLPIEALVLGRAFGRLSPKRQRRIQEAAAHAAQHCPFLLNHRCSVYPQRPLICRSHGLPIGYYAADGTTLEVSVCPKNFSPEFSFEPPDILIMDSFTSQLQSINQRLGRGSHRIALAQLVQTAGDDPPVAG